MTPAEYVEAGVLTQRQADVYRYHLQGASYGQTALMLGVTKETVRDHLKKAQRLIHNFHVKETA